MGVGVIQGYEGMGDISSVRGVQGGSAGSVVPRLD